MNAIERRKLILNELKESNKPFTGSELAIKFGVTRQIIVKDIALLRAESNDIIATSSGYIILKSENKYKRLKKVIAVCHDQSKIEEELSIVIKYGGIIEDVIVEHPLYGEIKANLMIKNLNELHKFIERFEKLNAKPLAELTEGVHIHTISADSEENLKLIIKELEKNNFLIH